jgi:hypothetical protein
MCGFRGNHGSNAVPLAIDVMVTGTLISVSAWIECRVSLAVIVPSCCTILGGSTDQMPCLGSWLSQPQCRRPPFHHGSNAAPVAVIVVLTAQSLALAWVKCRALVPRWRADAAPPSIATGQMPCMGPIVTAGGGILGASMGQMPRLCSWLSRGGCTSQYRHGSNAVPSGPIATAGGGILGASMGQMPCLWVRLSRGRTPFYVPPRVKCRVSDRDLRAW